MEMQHAVTKLHRLGPRPIFEFFCEIVHRWPAERRAWFLERLHRYADLDPAALRKLGGDQFSQQPLHVVKR
jgi:hypothetical protein